MPDHFTKIPWPKIRERVKNVNADLYSILNNSYNQLSIEYRYVYLASYKYGLKIVNKGEIAYPCNNPSCSHCTKLKKRDLSYSQIPLCIPLNRSCEVNTANEDMTLDIPLRILNPGEPFGVFEVTNSIIPDINKQKANWNVISGFHSIIIQYGFPNDSPRPPRLNSEFRKNHWKYIQWCAANAALDKETLRKQGLDKKFFQNEWDCDILIIPRFLFIDYLSSDDRLKIYLLSLAWSQSYFLRRQAPLDIIIATMWDRFVRYGGRGAGKTHSRFFLQNLYKGIYNVMKGRLPGFIPVEMHNAPEDIFLNAQKWLSLWTKKYPLIFQPASLSADLHKIFIPLNKLYLPGVTGLKKSKSVISYVEVLRYFLDLYTNNVAFKKGQDFSDYLLTKHIIYKYRLANCAIEEDSSSILDADDFNSTFFPDREISFKNTPFDTFLLFENSHQEQV